LAIGLATPAAARFQIEEATIDDIQTAIKNGETTCHGVVEAYIARAKAYNGACTALVTKDGAPIPPAKGYVRAGKAISYPTETIPVSRLLPDLGQYQGPPLDLGHMDATASDPAVKAQYGMVMGRRDAGQVNALETLNIRGERSVSCKASCDTNPKLGPLPAQCPAACEAFRQQPDALERADALDRQYGRKPDLAKLPMYCAVMAVKDWYDVKDIRSTGGNDVAFAMDAAPRDATVVARLRDKGAIIYAVAIAAEVTMGSGPVPGTKSYIGGSGSIRSSWAGHVCNPYDTERSAGPSSGGSAAAVSANLATCAVCETTSGSCREPANQNGVASFVATKGLTSEDGTANTQFVNHRPGALCRTIGDAARVVDAMKDDGTGFDARDIFTAQPKTLEPGAPYASFTAAAAADKPLKGMRVGIVREFMIKPAPNDIAITDAADREIKAVLRDKLGAELVESTDPLYPDDPAVPNMTFTFQDALAEVLPITAPEYFFQMKNGAPEFAVPGYDVRTRDYLVKLSLHQAPLSDKLNLRRIIMEGFDNTDRNAFSMARYLAQRGDARVKDWPSYVANSKWRSEEQAAVGAEIARKDVQDIRATEGVDRLKMQAVFRMVLLKVMRENHIDVLVHPNIGLPQWKIGVDREPVVDDRYGAGYAITDTLGVPEVSIPAGFNDIVYDPHYELSADKKSYRLVAGKDRGRLNHPMPYGLLFWAGPGDEAAVLKTASAYEAASHHRDAPPAFGPVPAQ
jgi:Asp-tRNA(Asn)/Glu-tRNA(Gln) amidotransferase A subunit family amidase